MEVKNEITEIQPSLDMTDQDAVEKYASEQKYIQPPRRSLIQRKYTENYDLPSGAERIILSQFFKRKDGNRIIDTKSDVFYMQMKLNITENIKYIISNKDIWNRLVCNELKKQQSILRKMMHNHLIIGECLLRWKYDYFQDNDCTDNFKFEILFKYFVVRKKCLHNVLMDINNKIGLIVLRAEDSLLYLKKTVRMINGLD